MIKQTLAIITLTAIAILPGTTGSNETVVPSASAPCEDPEIQSYRQRYLQLGMDVYDHACAGCHQTGENGAPRAGVRDDWSDRSPLWSAVLIEHAKSGYLDMPARGGHAYLSDRAVEAAGEYMLSLTFPELPVD